MCGIAGQVGRDPRTIQRRYAAYCAMQQTLARRGPRSEEHTSELQSR